MREVRWVLLTMLGTACGTPAADTTRDERLDGVEQENVQLRSELDDANAALATVTARLDALEAHERLVAAEVIGDDPDADGVSDDLSGLSAQLGTSRIDALEGGAAASCTDICVTDTELADALADYATDAEIAPLATRVEVEAGDEALRQWVIDQNYLTAADLTGFATEGWVADQGFATVFYVDTQNEVLAQSLQAGDAADRQWVVDQHFATETWVDGRGYLTDSDLDPYATDADLAALTGRVSTIEGDYLQEADLLTYATDADLAALAGRVSTIEGDYLRADDLAIYATQTWVEANYPEQAEVDDAFASQQTELDGHEDRLGALESSLTDVDVRLGDMEATAPADGLRSVGFIDDDVTLEVPGQFADVHAALAWLGDKHIDSDAVATIHIADGVYAYTEAITVRHPDGDRVYIIGNSAEPANVVLRFDGVDGVVVETGNALGWLSGVTLRGNGGSDRTGLEAHRNGTVIADHRVIIEDFDGPGMIAAFGGVITADSAILRNNDQAGAVARAGGVIRLQDQASVSSGVDGLVAELGGVVEAAGATASDMEEAGFVARLGGAMNVSGGTAARCGDGFAGRDGGVISAHSGFAVDGTGSGALCTHRSYCELPGLVSSNNDSFGVYAGSGSWVFAASAGFGGNANGDISIPANVLNAEGAYIER